MSYGGLVAPEGASVAIGRLISSFVLALVVSVGAAARETNSQVLDKVWAIGKAQGCSREMRARFDGPALAELKSRLVNESDRDALARVLNPFLFSFGYSHTQFFTRSTETFYLFRGYYALLEPSAPPVPLFVSPGIRAATDEHGYFVRDVLHGYPAHAAGVRRGDRILTVDGKPFSGLWGSSAKSKTVVRFSRQGQGRDVSLSLHALNWAQAFQDATMNSVQLHSFRGRKIGYVRLWSGVHPESASAVWKAVRRFRAERVDGVVLDLRGGYGGAFWDHLDPFFADRRDYFEISTRTGDEKTTVTRPPQKTNKDAYLGPMVVLIDEGSRSGKEAMAFQFKKSKRAPLVGATTAGYFAGGGFYFADQPFDYVLYLCVHRDSRLDGVDIEGVGVRPDVMVPFDVGNPHGDSQLAAGLELLGSSYDY